MKKNTMMKTMRAALIAAVMMCLTICMTTGVQAADQMLDTTISKAATKIDKKGNEYVQFIIKEDRSLNGFQYTTDVVIMCFGTTVDAAKLKKAGDTIKAVVTPNEYQGRLNYNMVALVE